jgi:hypothetical protein
MAAAPLRFAATTAFCSGGPDERRRTAHVGADALVCPAEHSSAGVLAWRIGGAVWRGRCPRKNSANRAHFGRTAQRLNTT